MSRIGFVLLTHNKPHQILRLVNRLNTMFECPPIVCHHDFGKCPLPPGFLPGNVSFVLPHLDTGWAEYTVVEGAQRAIAQMYTREDPPDWCVILSGACYPTKPADQILANLDAGGYDAHIDAAKLVHGALATNTLRMYFDRLCVKTLSIPSLDKHLHRRTRWVRLPHFLGRYLLPYGRGMQCYAGSQWFSLNRRAAEYLPKFQKTPAAAALIKHFRGIWFSEECYFQTALCNAPHLKIDTDNQVYLDWSQYQFHPKTLTLEDLPALAASPAHFARKLDPVISADLLDALDKIIDSAVPVPHAEKEKVSR